LTSRSTASDSLPAARSTTAQAHNFPCPALSTRSAKLKLDRLRRRGKAPPKKGAGKRAGKKK